MSEGELEPAVRALSGRDLWETCRHEAAGGDDHSCPTCGGTLRRCCDSLVGMYEHREGCAEVARRAGTDAA